MVKSREIMILVVMLSLISLLLGGCATITEITRKEEKTEIYYKPVKTVASYEEAGKWWGTRHSDKNMKLTPGQIQHLQCPLTMVPPPVGIDLPFVEKLISKENLDFFWVHSDLKDAFKKGYRLGFEKREADLVLGPHLTAAAGCIGLDTSQKFVDVITAFEQGWARTLRNAVDVFIVLISEGSQADRETFISNFTQVYARKYEDTQALLRAGGFIAQVSAGGTVLHIDVRKTKAVLEIPTPMTLKAEIYHQTFRVMGDEWGRRFSTNLIKRDELVDLLRRSKTALQEVPQSLESNMGIVHDAFVSSYGTDAENVFTSLIKDAGYTIRPVSTPVGEPPRGTPTKKRGN